MPLCILTEDASFSKSPGRTNRLCFGSEKAKNPIWPISIAYLATHRLRFHICFDFSLASFQTYWPFDGKRKRRGRILIAGLFLLSWAYQNKVGNMAVMEARVKRIVYIRDGGNARLSASAGVHFAFSLQISSIIWWKSDALRSCTCHYVFMLLSLLIGAAYKQFGELFIFPLRTPPSNRCFIADC